MWASGAAYEPYVGRWSRLVAPRFVDWLDPPAGRRWLDVGSGTGALTQAVLAGAAPAPAYCTALPEPARDGLRERLRADLPVAPDGSIALSARAWAARGTVPG